MMFPCGPTEVRAIGMSESVEAGNGITISMKSSTKSLAILPQHMLNIKRNEVDKYVKVRLFPRRFVRINMDCGVDGFEIMMPHQAGAAITVALLLSPHA